MDSSEVAVIAGGTRFRGHGHETVHVATVLSGGFAERERSGWRDMTPGVLRVSAAARHDLTFGHHTTRCLVIEAEPGFPGRALHRLARPAFLGLDPWLHRLVHQLSLGDTDEGAHAQLRQSGLRTELFAQLERRLGGRPSPPPPWLEQVRECLHDSHGLVTVHALATQAQVHRVHLARAFRDHFGVPITVYARRIQLDAAHRLLTTSALPLSQVAILTGFADQSHLTRSMRSVLGCTPGTLRRAALHRFKTTG